jgi:hypothetical protein
MRSALSQLPGFYGEPVYLDVAHFGSAGLAGRVPGARQREIAGPGDLGDVVRGHRLVIGHYAAASLLDAGCTGLAVQVREPRSRVLSLYRFWQENPAEERAGWGPWGSDLVALADRPLGEFLRSGAVWPAVDNAIRRQLLAPGPPPARVRTARGRRRFASDARYPLLRDTLRVVAWSGDSEDFLARVCGELGVTSVPVLERENVTRVRAEPQVVDRATYRRLVTLTAGDTAVLDRLTSDGLLRRRSAEDLDREFAETARRLSFTLDI